MYKDWDFSQRRLLIDDGINDYKVFDDIIKRDGSLETFEFKKTEQPKVGNYDFYHMTLEQIAQEMGVTRERVRQIEGRALRKLGTCNTGDKFEKEKRAWKTFY